MLDWGQKVQIRQDVCLTHEKNSKEIHPAFRNRFQPTGSGNSLRFGDQLYICNGLLFQTAGL